MSGRELGRDPLTKIRRIFHQEPDGSVTIHTEQNVDAIKDIAAEEFKDSAGSRWHEGINLVARIPISIYFECKRLGWDMDDPKVMRDWLNDPDNRAWRTRPGKI